MLRKFFLFVQMKNIFEYNIRSGVWQMRDRNRFLDKTQMRPLFLCFQKQSRILFFKV